MRLRDKMFSLISDWKASGEFKSKFLKGTGISTAKFDYWLKKYNDLESASAKPCLDSRDFIQVGGVLEETTSSVVAVLELSTPGGITIKVFE